MPAFAAMFLKEGGFLFLDPPASLGVRHWELYFGQACPISASAPRALCMEKNLMDGTWGGGEKGGPLGVFCKLSYVKVVHDVILTFFGPTAPDPHPSLGGICFQL